MLASRTFNLPKKLRDLLILLKIEKGLIESLSINDCVLLQWTPTLTTLTVSDPGRARVTMYYVNTDSELQNTITPELNESNSIHSVYSVLLQQGDLYEKLTRVNKLNTDSVNLVLNAKGVFNLKTSSILNGRSSSSTLTVKSYPGSLSHINFIEEPQEQLCKIYGSDLGEAFKVVNMYSEASKEKRVDTLNASKQLLISIDPQGSFNILTSPKGSELSNIHIKINVNLNTSIANRDEVKETIKYFGIESRYAKQLSYICTDAEVCVFISIGTRSFIRFKSTKGDITISILTPIIRFIQNVNFFLPTPRKFENVTIKITSQSLLLLDNLINAVLIHSPITNNTFINKVVFLYEEDTNQYICVPAADIQGKERSAVDIILNNGSVINFISVSNTLCHNLRVMKFIQTLTTSLNENEQVAVKLTIKEIVGSRVSTINLLLNSVILNKNADTDEYELVREIDNYQIWMGIDTVQSNMDQLEIKE